MGVLRAQPDHGQPVPVRTKYCHHGLTTAILRTWASPADVRACRLCPPDRCRVDAHRQCLVVVGAHVPAEACPLYREESPTVANAGTPCRLKIVT
jgi:hypothetical protein